VLNAAKLGTRTLLGTKGIATRSKRTLLVAGGLTTRNKKQLVTKGLVLDSSTISGDTLQQGWGCSK